MPIPLEQFNEEVMKELKRHSHDMGDEGKSILLQDAEDILEEKLTEQKALILGMVRERAPKRFEDPGHVCDCETQCGCPENALGWNDAIETFLNNLDTI